MNILYFHHRPAAPSRLFLSLLVALQLLAGGCANTYYNAMEKAGFHKRDILTSRVKKARNAQSEAQEQFKSALEQFSSVINIGDSNLKKAYEKLNGEYEASEKAAKQVSTRIRKVESVSDALFSEWEKELAMYQNVKMRESSRRQLEETRDRYRRMLAAMHKAEKSMEPVLRTFRDNVLFLKHNLNARAIGALRGEFSVLEGEIDSLIQRMNESIKSSDAFIAELGG